MKHLFTIISILIMSFSDTACSQGNDKQIVKLDESLLQQATSVSYSFDNGTVAPDYRYDCWVTVSKDSVRLSVIAGYGKEEKMDSIVPLQAGQYEQFIASLVNLSIAKVPLRGPMPVGGPVYKFWVYGDDSTLFGGEEDYDLHVNNGSISNTFYMLLPPELQNIMKNPEQLMER
jgi:hypothetical protein